MPSLPPCPRFTKGHGCDRSDPVLISDQDAGGTVWSFYCRNCKLAYVISKPVGKAAARYENAMNEARRKARAEREHARRPKYYDQGGH